MINRVLTDGINVYRSYVKVIINLTIWNIVLTLGHKLFILINFKLSFIEHLRSTTSLVCSVFAMMEGRGCVNGQLK